MGDCIYGCVCGGGGGIAVRDCIWVCGGGGGGVHRSTVKHVKATTRIRRPPTLADHCYQDQGMLFPVNQPWIRRSPGNRDHVECPLSGRLRQVSLYLYNVCVEGGGGGVHSSTCITVLSLI